MLGSSNELGFWNELGSWTRRKGFWLLDALQGGTIAKHLQDIREIMGDGITIQQARLDKLLRHAQSTVPFYRELAGRVPLKNLSDYPVVTKADYKDHYDAFHSEAYLNQPVHTMTTSGSTGMPFTVKQDINKRKRVLADIIYFNELGGQRLGDRYLYLRFWNEKTNKSKVELLKQNLVPIDITHPGEAMPLILQTLKQDRKIFGVLGYGFTFTDLAKYLRAHGTDPSMFNLKVAFSSSSILDLQSKHVLSDTLGCPVYDRYSNMENGIIAQSFENSDEFLVNRAGYYLELLDLEEDRPAGVGETGRIVITDLYNYAFPMIRYDTGDTAIKQEEGAAAQTRFKNLQGRGSELLYNTEGILLSPGIVSHCVWKFEKIKQFQLIQESAFDYLVKVNGSKDAYPPEDIIKEFKLFLGSDANIVLEFVDEIPVAASGKFRTTINNYEYDERNYHNKMTYCTERHYHG